MPVTQTFVLSQRVSVESAYVCLTLNRYAIGLANRLTRYLDIFKTTGAFTTIGRAISGKKCFAADLHKPRIADWVFIGFNPANRGDANGQAVAIIHNAGDRHVVVANILQNRNGLFDKVGKITLKRRELLETFLVNRIEAHFGDSSKRYFHLREWEKTELHSILRI